MKLIWRLVIAAVVAGGGCKRENKPKAGGSGSGSAVVIQADGEAGVWPGAGVAGSITLSVPEPRTGAPGARCSLAGDPLAVECSRGPSIAIDGDGRVYATDSVGVRRFTLDASDASRCALALDPTFGTAGVLARPELAPPAQKLGGGTVFMASGGPEWRLIAGPGNTMYYVEFLRGVHRIDRGKVEPVCPALQGVRGIATGVGKAAVVGRDGGGRGVLAGKCKLAPAGLDPKPTSVVGIGGAVWGWLPSFQVVKYGTDGKSVATLGGDDAFAPGGMCSVVAIAPCGDDVCVVDSNCQKVERFAADGTFVREIQGEAMFATRPYGLSDAAGGGDGALWVAAIHKDGARCEGAIYRVP